MLALAHANSAKLCFLLQENKGSTANTTVKEEVLDSAPFPSQVSSCSVLVPIRAPSMLEVTDPSRKAERSTRRSAMPRPQSLLPTGAFTTETP